MFKDERRFLFVMLGVSALVFGCRAPASPPAPAPPTTQTLDNSLAKIRFGYGSTVIYPTIYAASEQGFFTQENLDVELNPIASSPTLADALASGNLDISQASPLTTIHATVKGARTIIISGLENTFTDSTGKQWEATYLVVREGDGIRNVGDLKGKKIAVGDINSSQALLIRSYLISNHIDPDKDLSMVIVPIVQMPNALLTKQVDAAQMTSDAYLQAQKQGSVTAIATHSRMMNLDSDISTVLSANTDFLQRYPDAVARFLRAMLRARQWMADDVAKNDGKNLTDDIAKGFKITPEQARAFYELRGAYYGKELEFVNLLDLPARVADQDVVVLKRANLLKPDLVVHYEQIVDIRPLKRASESLGLGWDDKKH